VAERELKPGNLLRTAALARRYFIEGRSKVEIADEFGLSRFQVARFLEQARESGLVQIRIALPARLDAELSAQLGAAWGLRHAVVMDTSEEPAESLRAHLGAVAAALLAEIVSERDVLGMGWGRTMQAVTASLQRLAPCTVVQLTGVVGTVSANEESLESVRRVAQVSGGPSFPLYAPLLVDTPTTAAALRRQPQVAEALRRHAALTKAVVSVGSWDPPDSQLLGLLPGAEREALVARGVKAEICSVLLDAAGRPVASELTGRTIAVTAEHLRIPDLLLVAGGTAKHVAVRAALASGLVTSIVTDAATARAVIEGRSTAGRAAPPVPPLVAATRRSSVPRGRRRG
jgi:DNA-binding transcriptional regulator LsrR (DeoR family)